MASLPPNATLLVLLAALSGAATPTWAQAVSSQAVGPNQPILATVGAKRMVAFYTRNSEDCAVQAVLWEDSGFEDTSASSSVRVRMSLRPGQTLHLDSVKDERLQLHSLSLKCGQNGESLAVANASEQIAETQD